MNPDQKELDEIWNRMQAQMDGIWADVDATFAEADKLFERAAKHTSQRIYMDEQNSQTVRFQAMDLGERIRFCGRFVSMAFQVLFMGRTFLTFKKRQLK
jgi:hypothetical protein